MRKANMILVTWEGGWHYGKPFLVRAVWGLDHTTPHTLHHINIHTTLHEKGPKPGLPLEPTSKSGANRKDIVFFSKRLRSLFLT